jgi:hypothetical protein
MHDQDGAPRLSNRILDQKLTRFLLRRCLDGVAAGLAVMLGLLWTDVGGVGGLVRSSDHGVLALAMLSFAFSITFGSAAMGVAINGLGRRGGGDDASSEPAPVRVAAEAASIRAAAEAGPRGPVATPAE